MKSFFVRPLRMVKKAVQKLDEIENRVTCNQQVYNNGGIFFREAKVVNLQKKPENIIIGRGSYIRGELLIYPYGGKIVIGDNCYIGERTKVWSGEDITIGNNVLISHNVNIMDTNAHEIDYLERAASYVDMISNGHPPVKGSVQTAPVIIEDHVWLGFNVTILKGVRIGKGAIIAAGSVVTKNVPGFVLAGGNPVRILKQLNGNKE